MDIRFRAGKGGGTEAEFVEAVDDRGDGTLEVEESGLGGTAGGMAEAVEAVVEAVIAESWPLLELENRIAD